MKIYSTKGWEDYELLDSGGGYRLERFGDFILKRPDPQIIWQPKLPQKDWDKAHAVFDNATKQWVQNTKVPDKWLLRYKNVKFWAELSPFKHTGVFPEQTINWDWMVEKMRDEKGGMRNKEVKVLNLFAYTGIASLVCAATGAQVTHVDASRPTIGWARTNQAASGLEEKPIRWILDDVVKFVQREVNRGNTYEGIIMDPPIYGHGPKGEKWDFYTSFPELLELCRKILSPKPLFFLVNAYAISASSLMLENVLGDFTKDLGGNLESGELAIQEKNSDRLLSTGIFARWSA